MSKDVFDQRSSEQPRDEHGEVVRQPEHKPEPHSPDKTHAGDGQGTTTSIHEEGTLERPILDGSSMTDEEEHDVDNPWRGLEDPALSRHPETGQKSKNPYGG